MALMDEQKKVTGAGAVRTIEEGAEDLFFTILQVTQYQFPFKSTVRELMSNGVDSLSEKKMAREILTGKAKTEDYYEQREGTLYKDSHFDPSYYSLEHLNTEDRVELRYIIRSGQRDLVVISDTGVGMNTKRLQGNVARLGFSTKRLSKKPLGKFGIGGKSALSTGVDFYTVENIYNGRKYLFNVYSKSFDSLIGKMNLETGQMNQLEIWAGMGPNGTDYPVYSEATSEKNGARIIIEAKKHNQQEYINAVKGQMLYFKDVFLILVHEDGHEENIPFQANIIYEDDYILLGDQSYWGRPHLLLNYVNYGNVNWEELEMKNYGGAIGIKALPEEVEVNPNRESLIWNEKTKLKMLERVANVKETATRVVQEQLQTTDFVDWYRKCKSIEKWYRGSGDSITSRLASMVNIKELTPVFKGDERIRFTGGEFNDPTSGLMIRHIRREKNLKKNQNVWQIKREQIKTFDQAMDDSMPIVLMDWNERASNRKDKWLCHQYSDGFLAVYSPLATIEKLTEEGNTSEGEISWVKTWMAKVGNGRPYTRADVYKLIGDSAGTIVYSDVEVPKDFTGTEEEEDEAVVPVTEEEKKEQTVSWASAEERRKAQGKVVLFTPRTENSGIVKKTSGPVRIWINNPNYDPASTDPAKQLKGGEQDNPNYQEWYEAYTFQKVEVPIASINNWDAPEIYYGYDGDKELLHIAAMITRDVHPYGELGKSIRSGEMEPRKFWRSQYNDDYGYGRLMLDMMGDAYDQKPGIIAKALGITEEEADAAGRESQYGYDLQHFYKANVMLLKVAQNNSKYFRDFLHIQQFFTRIKDQQITMSPVLIQWNTARILKEGLQKCRFLVNFDLFQPKFAELYRFLQSYVTTHYRAITDDSNGSVYVAKLTGLMGNAMENLVAHLDNTRVLQEYVYHNPSDSDGIAELARELFGNNTLKGGQAVDIDRINDLNALLEYAAACGPMFNHVNPLLTHGTSVPSDLEEEIFHILQWKNLTNYGNDAPPPEQLPVDSAHAGFLLPDADVGDDPLEPGTGMEPKALSELVQ